MAECCAACPEGATQEEVTSSCGTPVMFPALALRAVSVAHSVHVCVLNP